MAKVNNVIIISDQHCGCQMGLCPPGGIPLDDGGHYMPSKLQKKVWKWWTAFWHEVVPRWTRGEPYAVISNGDTIDGVHHGSVTQITHNLTIQRAIALEVMRPVVEAKKCVAYYHIRGTEAHGGKSGMEEEQLARELGAVPDDEGRAARYELWMKIGKSLAHFAHHIGTTSSSSYESSAVMRELTNEYMAAGQWAERPPDFACRSHRHRNIEVRVPCKNGYGIAFVTPGWQLKTPFVHRTGFKSQPPQFGGSLIRQGDEEGYTRHKVWDLSRPKVEG